MTPQQYLEAFVEGNYYDFESNPGCVRRAFNAAVSASHLADHCFAFYGRHDPSRISAYPKIGNYVGFISLSTNGYFQDIRSIANAYKHLYTGIDPNKAQYSSISSAGTIETIQLHGAEIEEVREDYSDQSSLVIYTTKSGQQKQFMTALKTVVEFWRTYI